MILHRLAPALALLGLAQASALASVHPDGHGQAVLATKVLTAEYGGVSAVDNALILVKDGRIEFIGPRQGVAIPEGYEVLDFDGYWVSPGMIDLHNHTAGSLGDLNDTVFLTNPGLRASAGAVPDNSAQRRALAAGVSAVLTIPGSGSNMGGQGVLQRTGFKGYEGNLIRNPGSLKLAQAGNPERSAPWYPRRSFMNYNTRSTFRRGVAYARRWEAFEQGKGPQPEKDLQFEIFRYLYQGDAQVSTHTQIYQVVLMTVTMVAGEFNLPVFIDHGTFDGYRVAPMAQEAGVNAILGPRAIQAPRPPFVDTDGKIIGVASGYQSRGHTMVGFNTDAPVIPQEELPLQAAMGVRYGFDNSQMDAVRGLTIVPAMTIGIIEMTGSLEAGKSADFIVTTGDPIDPRSAVHLVVQRGEVVYDTSKERRRW